MFLHLFNTVLEKIYKQTKLPTVICPQASSSDTCILPCFFTWFSNGTTGPKQPIKSTKSKFVTPKVAKSEVKVLHFCVVLPALQKTNNEPENQKTKKPRNQKKQKNKTILHTPRGRVVAESWVLSFFFGFLFFVFFWILVSFSHCRKTNDEPENKKPRNQQIKKTRNKKQKAKKTRLHTPRGE